MLYGGQFDDLFDNTFREKGRLCFRGGFNCMTFRWSVITRVSCHVRLLVWYWTGLLRMGDTSTSPEEVHRWAEHWCV